MKKTSLWQLFITFFKVGAFTFGGGYAMIAILEQELVDRKKWTTTQDMLDMIVIAESTPGVIAVNMATSVGFRLRGILGGIIATLGVVLPSFLIIAGLSFVIDLIADNVWYKSAFMGVQACVILLVVNAFVKMVKQVPKDAFSIVALVGAFLVSTLTPFNVIFLILIGAALGLCYCLVKDAVQKKRQPKQAAELPLQNMEQQDLQIDNQTARTEDTSAIQQDDANKEDVD